MPVKSEKLFFGIIKVGESFVESQIHQLLPLGLDVFANVEVHLVEQINHAPGVVGTHLVDVLAIKVVVQILPFLGALVDFLTNIRVGLLELRRPIPGVLRGVGSDVSVGKEATLKPNPGWSTMPSMSALPGN